MTKTLIKTLKSRRGDIRKIYQLGPNLYLIEGPSYYMRSAENMVDFEGGPCLFIGDDLIPNQQIISLKIIDSDTTNVCCVEIRTENRKNP